MTTIIKYYTTLANEGRKILGLWDEMKQEIPLQAQRYEDHQRRQKNKQYIKLEQKINYLTGKHENISKTSTARKETNQI
jgi:Mlc titration factor MtfA (ptsG expression regulator)